MKSACVSGMFILQRAEEKWKVEVSRLQEQSTMRMPGGRGLGGKCKLHGLRWMSGKSGVVHGNAHVEREGDHCGGGGFAFRLCEFVAVG